MKRFNEKPEKKEIFKKKKKVSMEEAAKMKIRKKLAEAALGLGVFLPLFEEEQPKTQEKPPIWSDATHGNYYTALSVAETGGEKNPWIRTRGESSTAYGPVQITYTTAKDYYNRYPDLFKGNEDYMQKFLEQGANFKRHMESKDPVYGRGGSGVLGGEEYHEPYQRMSDAIFQGMRKDLERTKKLQPGQFDAPTMIQRWRGVPREEDQKYYAKVEKQLEALRKAPAAAPATPAPAPAPTPSPAPAPAQPAPANQYKVQSGDTLSKIAKNTGKSIGDLMKANPQIKDPNKIRAGDTYNIP